MRLLLSLLFIGCASVVETEQNDNIQDSHMEDMLPPLLDVSIQAPPTVSNCAEESDAIYLIDSERNFYSFYPYSRQFNLIRNIDCQSGGHPISMSISREGIAYVLYVDPVNRCLGINSIKISDGACLGLTNFSCLMNEMPLFGMGFASDGLQSNDEKLYIAGFAMDREESFLSELDVNTWEIKTKGRLTGPAEMTGTAEGELWAFFALGALPVVAKIDKNTF